MVLLVDDDDDFRSALAANLIDDGYQVKQFARPADVPPIASLEAPAMVIIDYQMSGEDGLSFADRFHAVHSDVPIVIVTAYWSRALDAQVATRDFVTLRRKPIDYEALVELIPDNH